MRRAALLPLLAASAALADGQATMGELKTLAGQKAWPELLSRAEGIEPGARTDTWRELVGQAAAGVVRAVVVAEDPFERAAKADSLKERHAFLDGQRAFVAARDEAVLAGLRRCVELGEADGCWRRFGAYERTLSPAGSLEGGKLLKKSGFAPHRTVALFARAVGAKDAPACRDADVEAAVVAALDTPVGSDAAKAARQVAFEWCWSSMQPKLKASLVGASKYRLVNACQAMRERKALTGLQEDLCRDEEQ